MRSERAPLGAVSKVKLAARVWFWYALVRLQLRRRRLPDVVAWLARSSGAPLAPMEARRLGRIVDRVLRRGPFRIRCLLSSLVLFRLLREQGASPELVIGLPPRAQSHEAHAWVEIDARVVGPPPGRLGHLELTRYGSEPAPQPESAHRGDAENGLLGGTRAGQSNEVSTR